MVIEASALPGWTGGRVLNRLKQQPAVVQQLTHFQIAVEAVLQSNIRVLAMPGILASTAASLSRQYGLLTNDALVLSLMQHEGVSHLASHDTDFDRVPGITRYAPD